MKIKMMTQEELNNLPKGALAQMYMQLTNSFNVVNKQLEALQKQNNTLISQMSNLQDHIAVLTQQRFGRKTEKLSNITSDQLTMNLDDIMEIFNEVESSVIGDLPEEPEIETVTYTRKKRKGKREEDLSGIEVVVEPTIELSEDELSTHFPYGYKRLPDEIYKDLEFIPARFLVHEHHIAVYAGKRDTGIIKANRPERLLKNSILTPSLMAGILDKKYVQNLPLNRICADFKRKDVSISRQVMAGWVIKTCDRYLRPLYRELHKKILESNIIHCDETPFTLIHNGRGPNSKDYMWVYHATMKYGVPPIYIYQHSSGRSSKVPEAFLKGYKGTLVTDGYQAYHKLAKENPDNLVVAGCWAHAKRKFAALVKSTKAKGTVADSATKKIAAIFHIDNMYKGQSDDEILSNRQSNVKPLVDAFFTWLKSYYNSPTIDHGSEIYKAIQYCINQEEYLRRFLDNPLIPMTNNDAERSIRSFCVGKHSWYVIDSENGAEASAMMYSLAETAKANNLKPFEYFQYVLEEMLKHLDDDPADYIKEIVPWSSDLPDTCRKLKN